MNIPTERLKELHNKMKKKTLCTFDFISESSNIRYE